VFFETQDSQPNGKFGLNLPMFMKKFPLTQKGITALQQKLYGFDTILLEQESRLAAEDILSWVAARLELDVIVLETIRDLPMLTRQQLGHCFASCLLARLPFRIKDRYSQESTAVRPELSFAASFISQAGQATQGHLEIIIRPNHNRTAPTVGRPERE
jgi:hypothetical protein